MSVLELHNAFSKRCHSLLVKFMRLDLDEGRNNRQRPIYALRDGNFTMEILFPILVFIIFWLVSVI